MDTLLHLRVLLPYFNTAEIVKNIRSHLDTSEMCPSMLPTLCLNMVLWCDVMVPRWRCK